MPASTRADELREVADALPASSLTIAYGSGVFSQPGLYAADAGEVRPGRPASAAAPSADPGRGAHAAMPIEFLRDCVAGAYAGFPRGGRRRCGGVAQVRWLPSLAIPILSHHANSSLAAATAMHPAHAAPRSNMERNPSHYSWALRTAGPRWAARLGSYLGAGVLYNSMVPFTFSAGRRGLLKYGAATDAAVVSDCLTWDSMFLAGRLQKPVRDGTRSMAVHATMALLPAQHMCARARRSTSCNQARQRTGTPQVGSFAGPLRSTGRRLSWRPCCCCRRGPCQRSTFSVKWWGSGETTAALQGPSGHELSNGPLVCALRSHRLAVLDLFGEQPLTSCALCSEPAATSATSAWASQRTAARCRASCVAVWGG